MTEKHGTRIVIVGAGFGGLQAAHGLAGEPAQLTIIDRRNHHLFQPLLYQAATASLAPSEIAWPIRALVSRYANVRTLLGEVVGIDMQGGTVRLEREKPVPFDILILATGARHAYFGHDEWEPYAPGLKTLEDAVTIRRRILSAFEQAEWLTDDSERAGFLTFAIVGAGPTGVEIAGTIAELARDTLRKDFRNIDTRRTRVLLIEAGPRILPGFRKSLSAYAQKALVNLGVEIELGHAVTGCDDAGVQIGDRFVPAKTIIWAAGVAASPVSRWLHAPADRVGRAFVEPDLTLAGHPNVFVIGDAAHVETPEGKLVPGIAPAAKQEGKYVARAIKARLRGRKAPPPFRYRDAGSLATIGKRAAIVDFGWLRLTGRLAWWMWGFAHIYFLIGLRNRLAVALSWLWIYMSGQRSARLITQGEEGDDVRSGTGVAPGA
ncbi:MAG TPA: NAD(P)/FAD-dependent oxidoreductase [Rhodoblastus sp.]|nr:NAD(P)/FAD-dependent oxidoreductase [Rhodoblastus sp.]